MSESSQRQSSGCTNVGVLGPRLLHGCTNMGELGPGCSVGALIWVNRGPPIDDPALSRESSQLVRIKMSALGTDDASAVF